MSSVGWRDRDPHLNPGRMIVARNDDCWGTADDCILYTVYKNELLGSYHGDGGDFRQG